MAFYRVNHQWKAWISTLSSSAYKSMCQRRVSQKFRIDSPMCYRMAKMIGLSVHVNAGGGLTDLSQSLRQRNDPSVVLPLRERHVQQVRMPYNCTLESTRLQHVRSSEKLLG